MLDGRVGFSFFECKMQDKNYDADTDGSIGQVERRPVIPLDGEIQEIYHLAEADAIQKVSYTAERCGRMVPETAIRSH